MATNHHHPRVVLLVACLLASACHGVDAERSEQPALGDGRVALAMGSKNVKVGSVLVWNDDTQLHLDLALDPGYALGRVSACVAAAPFPWTPPGQCPYGQASLPPGTTHHELLVPLAAVGAACGGELHIELFTVILGADGARVGDAYAGQFKGQTSEVVSCCSQGPLQCAWGPPGTPFPAGAVEVSLAEYTALAADPGFEALQAGELQQAIEARQAQLVAARAYVDTAVAAHPGLAHLLPVDPGPDSDLVPMADGNYRMPLAGGLDDDAVIVHGKDWIIESLAASLQHTPSRANREENYRSLYPALPLDQREGLPGPEALAQVGDADLAAYERELTRRIERYVPYEAVPLPDDEVAAKPQSQDEPDPLTGCSNHHPQNLFKTYEWPLKHYTTKMRRQVKRGTCMAFAVVAGLETLVARKTGGLMTDYSEQELYARAKGIWFPTDHAYGDGLVADVLDEMVEHGTTIDAERRWPYNASSSRIDDEEHEKYSQSCAGYTGYCSETNHQRKIVCTQDAMAMCGWTMPPGVTGDGYDAVRLDKTVSLWNPLEPESSLASIRAHLNLGHPVVIGLVVDDLFRAAANLGAEPNYYDRERAGVVNFDEGGFDEEAPVGAHAMLVVGYVGNSRIPEDSNVYDAWGGGYLIAKNSWGCKGDGGYMYLAYDWVIDQTAEARAMVGVTTSATPAQATLSLDRSNLSAPGTVRLTATANARTTRLRIFRGLGEDELVFSGAFDGGKEEVRTIDLAFESGDQNGMFLYVAQATDQFGNVTISNIVALLVLIDDAAPKVSLSALSSQVVAPGKVRLKATATDEVSVAKVQFLHGLQLICTDYQSPYECEDAVGVAEVGTQKYVAVAFDTSGKKAVSNVLTVDVAPSWITRFTATPSTLPAGGGDVTLAWEIVGSSSYGKIAPGDALVSRTGTKVVSVTQSTAFVLTAITVGGQFTASAPVTVLPAPPSIASFTATPAALPAGGGASTLAWSVSGTGVTLTIDQGVGDVSSRSSTVVEPTGTTTYTLTASNAGGATTRTVTVTVAADTTPPAVSLAASPSSVLAPGETTLTATASDDTGVVKVDFYRAGVLFAGDTTPADGFTARASFTAADQGSVSFTAVAYDAAGSSATSAPAVVMVTAPTVTLTADPTTIAVPGSTHLTATVNAEAGVVRVEFLFEGTVFATDTTAADGFTASFAFGREDTGSWTFTAVAYDAAGDASISQPVVVSLIR